MADNGAAPFVPSFWNNVSLRAHQESGMLHSRMNRAEATASHSSSISLFPLLS